MYYLIVLKFDTPKVEKGRMHPDTKFGCNTINGHRVINDCAQKIASICCHTYRVNCLWQEAENQQGDRLTIEPQIFCYLKKSS